ncbi:MAG: hypothetical protein ABS46_16370 [Cytophagaceae bacterium SCN 52-12]|nr:MAG: hypothetical protein ABS46_16370 [Cytophagaceae bacterium SCN 52-12]
MAQETSKQRWNRIELDYYKGRGLTARWRSAAALAILAGLAAWLILAPSWDSNAGTSLRLFQTKRLASPGPLARPHASLETKCEACHTPFEPIHAGRWAPIRSDSAATSTSDTKCLSCHQAGPHHPSGNESVATLNDCAECHRDHRGPEASLTRMDDRACTRCHADLRDGSIGTRKDALTVAPSITRFDRDHPEFSLLQKNADGTVKRDPGRLKFNHQIHLTPGMNRESGGVPLLTYKGLKEEDRQRYGWKPGTSLDQGVTLDCTSCHRMATAAGSSRMVGETMMPVTYEANCRSCHTLGFDPRRPQAEARHGIPWSQVAAELRQFYEAQAVQESPELLRRPVPKTDMPGRRPDSSVVEAGRAVDSKVAAAIRMLLPNGKGGCLECHDLKSDPATLAGKNTGEVDWNRLEIEPTRIPKVWFSHARFDHSSHRALRCDSCHEQASRSTDSGDLLLTGIATCLQCHGPTIQHADGVTGGAGFNCAECHRYHDGGLRLHAPGQAADTSTGQPPESLKSIREFLDGVRTDQGPP